jgi:hypothetical protein
MRVRSKIIGSNNLLLTNVNRTQRYIPKLKEKYRKPQKLQGTAKNSINPNGRTTQLGAMK